VKRAVAATCVLLLLAGCATRRDAVREPAGEAVRASAVAAVSSWGFAGRIAVSNGNDGGSGRIDWRQDGERLDITIRAPVSGQTWRLAGDRDAGYELSGTKREPVRDANAEALLFNETGWRVPVAALERWVRGLPAARGRPRFGDDGLPAELREAGWTIEYRRFDTARPQALPTRIVARKGPLQVRLAIAKWDHG
jgi:outer membrane lipoprotein LolB